MDCFYKHSKMADGTVNKCKDCCKGQSKKRFMEKSNDLVYVESERSRQRDKYYRLGYRKKHRPTFEQKAKAMNRYASKYPEKSEARKVIAAMKPVIKGYSLHHWSYKEEHYADIIELPKSIHYLAHRHLVYDQSVKMYRVKESLELLDTKEKHFAFINTLNK